MYVLPGRLFHRGTIGNGPVNKNSKNGSILQQHPNMAENQETKQKETKVTSPNLLLSSSSPQVWRVCIPFKEIKNDPVNIFNRILQVVLRVSSTLYMTPEPSKKRFICDLNQDADLPV